MNQLTPIGHPSTWKPYGIAPFNSYKGMIRFLSNLQAQNDDALVLIDGAEGSGKSTLAFHTVTDLDPKWNPETGLIIDYDDWESVYELESGRVFLLDEGGDLMFSRDSQKGENKLVVKMFQMARIYNHLIVVGCPNIHWVDLYIRDHRALIYGHCDKEFSPDGVKRGKSTFHWPQRRFNWDRSEWESRWYPALEVKFPGIAHTYPQWAEYERFKKLKVQKRQMELAAGLRR